ncbi:hypothetical protein M0R45_013699 [Rubus argutus]|uniref:F-box domain-containing protein n=1 Tax=Rubus argutus TaxID=59490 RepID=A0AAW1XJW0_RUBAR
MSSPSSPKRRCGSGIRNWTELPEDVTASILSRLGTIDILETAQKVCTTWYKICKDPLMWRTIDLRYDDFPKVYDLGKMCRYAVDRSCGNLVTINLDFFGTDELLKYITDSSSGIRCLRLVHCDITDEGLSAVSSRLPLLEDLEISQCSLSHETLEVVGASCPLLKSLKVNSRWYSLAHEECNKHALAIADKMHDLRHLQIFANKLNNDGLQAILDCCPLLESLDLRQCYNLNLEEVWRNDWLNELNYCGSLMIPPMTMSSMLRLSHMDQMMLKKFWMRNCSWNMMMIIMVISSPGMMSSMTLGISITFCETGI